MSLLATYLVHSTAVLSFVWLLDRFVLRDPSLRDTAWKAGLVVSLLIPAASTWSANRPAPVQEAYRVRELRAGPGVPGVVPDGSTLTVDVIRRQATVDAACFRGAAAPGRGVPPAPADVLEALERCARAPGGGRTALLWLLAPVSLLMAGRHLRSTVRLRRLLARGSVVAVKAPIVQDAEPRILAVPGIAGPFAAGWRTIALPARGLRELSPAQLGAVLAHEVGHLERRDPLWQWWARLMAGVLYFQPLNLLCCRRLEEAAELVSDDRAYRRLGSGRALAESIALVSGWAVEDGVAPALARRRGLASTRVARLLGTGPGLPLPMLHLRMALVAAIVLFTLALPGVKPAGEVAQVDVVVRHDVDRSGSDLEGPPRS